MLTLVHHSVYRYAQCVPAEGGDGPFDDDDCSNICHKYRCDFSSHKCLVDDFPGGMTDLKACQESCHGYRCGVTPDDTYGCIEDDDNPAFNSCDGRCQQYSCNPTTSK